MLTGDDDEAFGVTVTEVNDESITFDSNHPLAGEDLTFAITLRGNSCRRPERQFNAARLQAYQ